MTTPITSLVRRLAALSALALALLGLGASAASAGQSQDISTERGAVWFNQHGDRLYAIDTKVDGKGVEASVTWAGHLKTATDRGAHGPPKLTNLDLPEGTVIELQMCYFTRSGLGKCSDPQTAIA
jgi:hypothetical protein